MPIAPPGVPQRAPGTALERLWAFETTARSKAGARERNRLQALYMRARGRVDSGCIRTFSRRGGWVPDPPARHRGERDRRGTHSPLAQTS